MPVVMIVLFGFALSTELKDVKIAVYSPSSDLLTDRIVSRIEASPYFSIVGHINDKGDFEDFFRKNKSDIIISFEDDFYYKVLHDGKGSVQILLDGTKVNISEVALFYLTNIISSCKRDIMDFSGNMPVMIDVSSRMLYNPQMKSSFNFVPGVMGMILMLVCAMMTSVSIVREKQRGTMEVLLVSPVKPFSVIIAKAVPYFVVSLVNLATIILLSVYLLGVPVTGSIGWVIAVSLLFVMVSLSLGILVSTLVSMQEEAILISGMVFMLPTILLSGMLFPIESLPEILQYISYAIPAKWYIESMRVLMIQGSGIGECIECVIVLAGFLIVITSASLLKFKDRL